jgi:pimeloyl-ACP methyl ester carboxylesterase
VFTPERRAHGHTPDLAGPITFELMATDTVAWLEAIVREPTHLVGCSDGAVVALLVALRRPDLVGKLVLCNVLVVDFLTQRSGSHPGADSARSAHSF